ncbi:putative hydroxypyruvate isomerase [Manis javanica]|nr:putative hydroxypyruvate isomerase [Manis javanica]
MPRFAANLSMLFTEIVLHNLPAGDWDAGERGIACHPDRVDEFRAGVAKAVTYGHALGVPQLNCLAGKAPAGADAALLRRTFVDNLRFAASALSAANLRLLIEPINPFDIPGFYLNRTDEALSILDEVGAPNAFVQYDIYHAQRTEGELAATLQKHLARIGHVQLADNPGRNEPGTGEINYPSCSRTWTASATRAGWAASTSRARYRIGPGLAGRPHQRARGSRRLSAAKVFQLFKKDKEYTA